MRCLLVNYPTGLAQFNDAFSVGSDPHLYWCVIISSGYISRCRTDTKPQKPFEVRGYTGSLVSPGYPYSYPIITCTWKIVVPDGYIVEVKIDDFDMACSGGSKLQVGKDTFCGSNKPSGLLTSESDLMIQMIITEAQDNRGFRATFTMTERG